MAAPSPLEIEAARAERAAPAPDPYDVSTREVAIALWSVADGAKTVFGFERQAATARRRPHREAAARALAALEGELAELRRAEASSGLPAEQLGAFGVPSREVAVSLWMVARAARAWVAADRLAGRAPSAAHRMAAGSAFVELGRELNNLGRYVEHERGR